MSDPKQVLRFPQVQAEGLDDWRFFLMKLHARFKTRSFVKGLELVTRITEAAEEADHHPDVVLTYPQVDIDLQSHDVHGVTSRDVALARRISEIAAELGIEAAPREVSTLEVALDVPDAAAVKPFWAAVLGYEDTAYDTEIMDPGGRNNTLWFQQAPDATGQVQQRFHLDIVVPREVAEECVAAAVAAGEEAPDVVDPGGRNSTLWFQPAPGATGPVQQRFHLDIVVPREVAEERVRAAVDAGGTLVSSEAAPAYWVLADAHGNKVCVCTSDGRDRAEE